METIEISEDTWKLLLSCAEPYVDKAPDDTLQRILRAYLAAQGKLKGAALNKEVKMSTVVHGGADPEQRAPRERGVKVLLDGENIVALSVRDLYEQALKILVKKYRAKLKAIVPMRTSSARFLIASAPKHPSGKGFVVPAEYDGFYMEAHKDYKNAIAHLRQLGGELGISCEYLGH